LRLRIIIILIGVIVVGTVAAAFAAGGDSTRRNPDAVVAAFYPLAFAAERVGGPSVQVSNLTPAGAEPHDLELTPDDVAKVK
jgi:zinc transport system substrate-binding protein